MRRRRLIKATAWINVGILILGVYSMMTTEHWVFSFFAVCYSVFWLVEFMWVNLPNGQTDETRESVKEGPANRSLEEILTAMRAAAAAKKKELSLMVAEAIKKS